MKWILLALLAMPLSPIHGQTVKDTKRIVGTWDLEMSDTDMFVLRGKFFIEKDSLIFKVWSESRLGHWVLMRHFSYPVTPYESGPKGMTFEGTSKRVDEYGDILQTVNRLNIWNLTKDTFTIVWVQARTLFQGPNPTWGRGYGENETYRSDETLFARRAK